MFELLKAKAIYKGK